MPSAGSYTSKLRSLASARNVKVQYPGGVAETYRPDRTMMCTNYTTTIVDPMKQIVSTLIGPETLTSASSVVVDKKGNIYIGDNAQNCIFKVDAITQAVSVIAGTRYSSSSSIGDGGLATDATFYDVDSLAFNPAGDLFVCETGVNRVRKIDMVTGIITAYAGLGGAPGFSGDGDSAISAKLWNPAVIAFDSIGNMYIADSGNNRIRKVDTSGQITTFAGADREQVYEGTITRDCAKATSATLNSPRGVVVDAAGNVFIADTANSLIRVVNTDGYISTLAGRTTSVEGIAVPYPGFLGDGGYSIYAALNSPSEMAFDSFGNLYISDTGNNRIRVINSSTKIIQTFAGNGRSAVDAYGQPAIYDGDGRIPSLTSLNYPQDIAFGPDNTIYVADSGNARIRSVTSGLTTAYNPPWFSQIEYIERSFVYDPITKGVLSQCACQAAAQGPVAPGIVVPPPNVCIHSALLLEGGYSGNAWPSNDLGPERFGENLFYGGSALNYEP
jgi:sugar lactone lactonase YvrE